MSWVSLCILEELTDGKGKYVEVDGFHLAVYLSDQKITVVDSTCPHAGANLADGFIDAGCIVCPWHYWSFQLEDGKLRDSPGIAIKWYTTRIFPHDGKQFVQAELPTF